MLIYVICPSSDIMVHQALVAMEHDSLVKLKSILSDVCGIDPDKVCLESRLVDDLGVDSLGMLECIIEFEDQFGVTIDASEVSPSVTILDIIRLVES